MTVIGYGARAGAALLMLGLWAGGSQAVASADDGSADQTASTHAGRGSAQHSAPSAGKQARNGAPATAAVTARARSAAPASATAVSRAVSLHRNASAAQPSATTASAVAAANGVVTAAPSEATIAVTNWFSSSWSWLDGFNDPLAQALQGALVEIQRRFFSPAPTVQRALQLTSWAPGGDPILGEVQYVQPGGGQVSFEVAQAPSFGTVQFLADGTYSYTPGVDFTGTDSFTAQVTSGGFNILEPFTPRTASVTVNVYPSPPAMLTQGFVIVNETGKGVYLTEIRKEPGYEHGVDAAAPPTILLPGQKYRAELVFYAFYAYDTRFVFSGCSDLLCYGYPSDGRQWTALIRSAASISDLGMKFGLRCDVGYCTDQDGKVIDSSVPVTEYFKPEQATPGVWGIIRLGNQPA